MNRILSNKTGLGLGIAAVGMSLLAGQTFGAATSFVTPGAWTVGDASTTYQEWDTFAGTTGNTPDVGLTATPAISTTPTVSATGPGFVAGSGNFYSFSADYGFAADIYNHGGASGTGGLAAGSGTHAIVQISATLNETGGVDSDTIEIVDLLGDAITGGDNASALRHDVLFEGIVNSSFGPVTQREEIWEFYLPDYVGDFRVQGGVLIHSSFDQLRVDSAIATTQFSTTAVPEPASLALLAAGGAVTLGRRARRNA